MSDSILPAVSSAATLSESHHPKVAPPSFTPAPPLTSPRSRTSSIPTLCHPNPTRPDPDYPIPRTQSSVTLPWIVSRGCRRRIRSVVARGIVVAFMSRSAVARDRVGRVKMVAVPVSGGTPFEREETSSQERRKRKGSSGRIEVRKLEGRGVSILPSVRPSVIRRAPLSLL